MLSTKTLRDIISEALFCAIWHRRCIPQVQPVFKELVRAHGGGWYGNLKGLVATRRYFIWKEVIGDTITQPR
jgi:hypothetical protein